MHKEGIMLHRHVFLMKSSFAFGLTFWTCDTLAAHELLQRYSAPQTHSSADTQRHRRSPIANAMRRPKR